MQQLYSYILGIGFLLLFSSISGQTGSISGKLNHKEIEIQYASLWLDSTKHITTSNQKGEFYIGEIPYGTYTLIISAVGFENYKTSVNLNASNSDLIINPELDEKLMEIDAVVVTGTKTFKRKTDSPVIVSILNSETLENIQACNLSDGLKFQPGLRVETDCQTCNYTQLRMNGLAGGYSQILINGRPIFSPLTGLYGMEQLPVNMIERIEVVRGGGSSLYGSSAIGGTVNIITKIPTTNSLEVDYNFQRINGQSSDQIINANSTLVSKNGNSGVSFFVNNRNRDFYDHNDDNFSELPQIENTSFGINFFLLPKKNQKIEVSLSRLNEYRYGGEMVDLPTHFLQQAEERDHDVWMGSADYQINFNDNNSSVITYFAWQNTKRDHYTGILPDDSLSLESHTEFPPYGKSDVSTFNIGIQFNHKLKKSPGYSHIITLGSELIIDDVFDEIEAYSYLVDQRTEDYGSFIQSDWKLLPQLSLLSGLRMDIHNLVDQPVFSPRLSLLYKHKDYTQFRINYGAGFRAPQAFDTDLHIAFAGGGISRVILGDDLQPEYSQSISTSINFDKPRERYVFGFTVEAFYTHLSDAFILNPIGEDEYGEVFEKSNGQGATVQGLTLELRANYNRKLQIESGLTLQQSVFERDVQYIDNIPGLKDFIRTPNEYGYAILSFFPNKAFTANVNYVLTGSMLVPHFAGAINNDTDQIVESKTFNELSTRLSYSIEFGKDSNVIELYSGVRNIFNAYQNDFDLGKNRDSNYVYGPGQPRTFYIGFKIRPST